VPLLQDKEIPAAFVSSPRSGDGTDAPRRRRSLKAFFARKAPGLKQHDVETVAQLKRLAQEFRDRGVKLVIHHVGDGGFRQYLTHVLPEYLKRGEEPPINALLDGGTQNVTHGDGLGVRGPDPLRTLEGMLDKLAHGDPLDVLHRNCLRVNGHHLTMIYCLGFITELLARYEEGRQPGEALGDLKAARVALEVFGEELRAPFLGRRRPSVIRPFLADIELRRGEEIVARTQARLTGALANTLTGLGMHLYPSYRAIERYNHFHFLGIRRGFWGLAACVPNVWRGRPMPGDPIDEVVTEARLRYRGERPKFSVNGDTPEHQPVEDVIAIGPRLAFAVS
jgi:hypothetical protein